MRLYYKDQYLKQFETSVTAIHTTEFGFAVELEDSAFFPGGGGQPADRGSLNGIEVTKLEEKDGQILHYIPKPLTVGTKVIGEIDFDWRFHFMQIHTAEHIFSGILFKKFNIKNVGFHMGSEFNTVDTDRELTPEEVKIGEYETNRAIFSNIETSAYTTCSTQDIRKLPKICGELRVVEIGNFDRTACCGMHLKRTAEAGIFKIINIKRYKKGSRITFLVGIDALKDYNFKNELLSRLCQANSTELATLEDRLQEREQELYTAKTQIEALQRELAERYSADLVRPNEEVEALLIEDDIRYNSKFISDAMKKRCKLVLVCTPAESGYNYILTGEENLNLKPLNTQLLELLGGRGGGRGSFFKGKLEGDFATIKRGFLELAKSV